MNNKRWFFTLHLHTDSVSIFETAEYGVGQGYGSKKEAVVEAINFLNKQIQDKASLMKSLSDSLVKLNEENRRLLNTLEAE